MLRIPTYLATSAIPGAGHGVFCRDFVPAGTLIWRFDPGLDLELTELPEDPELRRFVEVYGYMPLDDPPRWVICLDNGRFINHSDHPNTVDTVTETRAAHDLAPGTELTSDYRTFCRDPFLGWGIPIGPGAVPLAAISHAPEPIMAARASVGLPPIGADRMPDPAAAMQPLHAQG